ncbi:hypothetical protein NIES806_16960 [Dolichospermum compactum NIES-806]|uniref:Uncharacterized protein n=1 Tax=Dolichospermum compactum NIES-806 TaxID=1973481 RepID=A0A1Z4V233_9CYAN|nr:hypothetical protein NIES806_16960 [Dolichospermum compactum NIES-806]
MKTDKLFDGDSLEQNEAADCLEKSIALPFDD